MRLEFVMGNSMALSAQCLIRQTRCVTGDDKRHNVFVRLVRVCLFSLNLFSASIADRAFLWPENHVFHELQKCCQSSRIFKRKQGFVTLHDLFRWASCDAVGYQELAENGYASFIGVRA